MACLIDCVVSGSTDLASLNREKVRASLRHSPALAARISESRVEDASGTLVWKPDEDRVQNVVVKLARAHAAHQYSEPQLDQPERVSILPVTVMSDEERAAFETVPESPGWPEIGSRAFVNLIVRSDRVHAMEDGWTILQRGRYRYAISQPGGIVARMVLSEYLACEVVWECPDARQQ